MAIVGRAEVVVRALTEKFRQDLRAAFAQAEKDADKSGENAGSRFGAKFREGVAKGGPLFDLNDLGDQSELAGMTAGQRYREAFDRETRDMRAPTPRAPSGGGGGGRGGGGGGGDDNDDRDRDSERDGEDNGNSWRNGFNKGANAGGGPSLPAGFMSGFAVKLIALLPIIATAIAALSALVSGLFAVASAAAVAAAGGLALLPGALLGLGAAIGVGVLAFKGIGGAVKELGEQQAKSAKLAAAHGKAARAAARAVASASKAITDARKREADAEYQVGERIEDLARARRDAARGAEDAARRVADAEDNLAEAQERAREAQADLTRARVDAKEKLEDLQLSLRGAVLGEAEATLRLQRARNDYQETINDANATEMDREQARIDLEQAELALDQAKDRRDDVRIQTEAANKAGIEGSDEVVAAKEKIDDANKGVADSERDLARAREDQTRQAIDSAERIHDAQKALADAYDDVRDAAVAVADAQQRLADAQAAQAEEAKAYKDSQAALLEKYNALSPAAQRFAKYINSVRGQMKQLSAVAQEGVLPGVQAMLTQFLDPAPGKFFSVLKTGLGQTAGALGNFFRQLGRSLTTPASVKNLETFFKSNAVVIEKFGHALAAFLRAGLSLAAGVAPYMERFAGAIDRAASRFSNFIDESRANGELTKFMDLAVDSAKALGRAFGAIFDIMKTLVVAAAPFGIMLLDMFTKATKAKTDLLKADDGKGMSEFFAKIVPNVSALMSLLGALLGVFIRIGTNPAIKEIADRLTKEFVPALEDVINKVTTNFAPAIFGIITNITKFIAVMADSKVLKGLLVFFQKLSGWIVTIAKLPFAKEIIAGILVMGGALVVVNKAAKGFKILANGFRILKIVMFNLRVGFILLRAAMMANPIGFIIAGIVLLIAGLVLAYKKFEGFRNVVNAVVGAVVGAFKWLYNILLGHSIIPDIVNGLIHYFTVMKDAAAAIINALVAVVTGIFNGLKLILTTIFSAIVGVIKFYINAWITIFSVGFGVVKTVVSTIFNGVKTVVSTIFGAIKTLFTNFISGIKSVWSGLWNTLKTVASTIFGGVKTAIDGILGGIKTGFSKTVDFVKTVWNGIKEAVSAPIKTVIDFSYNKGLRAFWNKIAGLVHLKELPEIKFAKGGVVPGYAPGSDTVRALVSPGEGVLVPEAVRGLARNMGLSPGDAINAINATYSTRVRGKRGPGESGRFGLGGLNPIDKLKSGASYVGNKVSSVASAAKEGVEAGIAKVGDLALGALAKGAEAAFKPLRNWLHDNKPKGMIGDAIIGLPLGAMDGVVSFLRRKDKDEPDLGTGQFAHTGRWPAPITGVVSSNTAAAAEFVRKQFGVEVGTLGARANVSDHPYGKALDAMVGKDRRKGDTIAASLLSKQADFGLKYLIWFDRITNGSGWRAYKHPSGQSNPTLNHEDHVHASFLAKGATVLPRPGGTLAVLGEAGRAESVVDTGLINQRLRDDAQGHSATVAELRAVRAVLERIGALGGIHIDRIEATTPEGRTQAVGIARTLRGLAFELGQ